MGADPQDTSNDVSWGDCKGADPPDMSNDMSWGDWYVFFLSFAFILLLLTTLLDTNWICLQKITNEVGKDGNSITVATAGEGTRNASRLESQVVILSFFLALY